MVEPTLKVEPTLRPDLDAPQPSEVSPSSAASESQPSTEMAGGLEEQLKKAEAAVAEHRDAFLRAKAEGDNIRKRAQTEVTNAHKFAVENFSSSLLAVKDSLEAALIAENTSVE